MTDWCVICDGKHKWEDCPHIERVAEDGTITLGDSINDVIDKMIEALRWKKTESS